MPIMSYVVYSTKNMKTKLVQQLNAVNGCQAVPADNQDLVVLMTETHSEEEEAQLQKKLESIDTIQCMAMTYGHIESEDRDEVAQ